MNNQLLKALIRWIEIVTSMLLYMGENVPEDIRVDLHNAMHTLTEELRNDVRQDEG